jgi:hypothetical protein
MCNYLVAQLLLKKFFWSPKFWVVGGAWSVSFVRQLMSAQWSVSLAGNKRIYAIAHILFMS